MDIVIKNEREENRIMNNATQIFCDETALVVHASYINRSKDMRWNNDPGPVVRYKDDRGPDFFRAHTIAEMKENIASKIHKNAYEETCSFYLEHLKHTTEDVIYAVQKQPKILDLNEDRVSALIAIVERNPEILRQLSDSVAEQFLGNSYTFGHEYFASVGEGDVKTKELKNTLPKAYDALMNKEVSVYSSETRTPSVSCSTYEGKLFVRTADKERFKDTFFKNLSAQDVPALTTLADGSIGQWCSANLISKNWDAVADKYDGYTFTNIIKHTNGEVKESWPETHLHSSFAHPNTKSFGSVRNLMQEGILTWPAKQSKGFLPRIAKGIVTVFSLATEGGRDDIIEKISYAHSVKKIKKSAMGCHFC